MRAGVCVVFGKSRRSSGVEESITQQRAARKSVEAVHIARDKGTKQSITRLSLCTAVATVGRWRAQDIETLCSAIFFLVVHKFDGVLVVEDSAEEVVRHIGTPVRRCRRRAHTLESVAARRARRAARRARTTICTPTRELFPSLAPAAVSLLAVPEATSPQLLFRKMCTASKASHTRRAPLPCSQTCAPLTLVPLSKLRRSFPAGAKAPAPAHENISRNKGAA